MIKPALRYLSITAAALVICVVALTFWLLRTDAGAAWLWARAVNALPDTISAASLSGNLRQGIVLQEVYYRDSSVDVRASTLSLALDPDWWGWTLEVTSLHADGVNVQLLATGDEGETGAANIDDVLSSLQLPIGLSVDDVLLENVVLLAPEGAEILAFDSLTFVATWDESLTIDRLRYSSQDMRVTGAASLALEEPYKLSVASEVNSNAARIAWLPATLRVQLAGNLQKLIVAVNGAEPALKVSGQITDVPGNANLNLLIESGRFDLPRETSDSGLHLTDLVLRLSGNFDDYAAQLDTQVNTELAAPVEVTATVSGDLQSLTVEQLVLSSSDIDATATGAISWGGKFAASALLTVQRFDPQRWLPTWPEAQFVSGLSEFSYLDGRLEVDRLEVVHSDSDATIAGTGNVNTLDGNLDIDLTWQDLQWPLPPASAEIDSQTATLNLQGKTNDWTLQGQVALGARDLPEGRFEIEGEGDLDSLAIAIKDSAVLGGHVVGQLVFDRRAGGRWSAELASTDTRITPLVPAWPGQVSANFTASGVLEPFELDVNIAALTGDVRGREVSASGRMRLTTDMLRFNNLQIQSNSSRLQLDGDWQDSDGVTFSLASASLTDLVPGAVGSVQADGVLKAGDEWPLLSVTMTGEDLGYEQFHAAQLAIRNESDATGEPFALLIEAQELVVANYAMNAATLALRGAPAAHQLEFGMQREDGSLNLALQGGVDESQPLEATMWRGDIENLQFQGRDDLVLALRDSAALEIGQNSAMLGQSCIDVSGGGELCLSGQLLSPEQYRASFALTELPLDLLRSFTSTNLKFDQVLSGTMEVATGPRGRPSGTGRIDITPGQILNVIDDSLTLRTRAGFVSFELQDGQLLAGEVSLPFSDAAEIAGEFRVADVAQGQASPIKGNLTAVVRDLGVGARILPQIKEAGGSLDADISIDGTLGTPNFAGGLAVRDGRVMYEPLGLSLENIQLSSKVLAGNRVELTSTFDAGEGSGRISSSADYLQGLSGGFEVSLAGENLSIVDLPDLRVVINPEIELGIRGNDIQINGQVVVPTARVASIAFINSGVSESEDVVYVGPVQPVSAASEEPASPLNFGGSIALELGDDVAIDLDVAEARVRGKTTYQWEGPALPSATGNFAVSGKFEAYGQLLEITEGTIRYANAPASNPQLRIRAEREIFGNSQVRRAGVFVSGTAQRPKLEVYTTPTTSPDRALTLLATGSDFNYDQGVGALDVGTYIAPKLYASYGIGLFDRENVISVRYDLTKGFGIKATSGRQAAGVDISYTIER
ncbi:MAG: hypothetical protein HKN35_01360 [Woeseia sp.]|nr:translocation/assembly module TamB domain-containing protein [Woeseia sp.]MBT8096021.1 translocation/assembly module TamB domain-containing protein [Woeseia sp.]NNE59524.1 hypothetical protein [Woeseia sp.]NNL54369.1 hypothetical protein [Woeseia sp.]